jgi:glycosyltransferase involved in cell wall biosynthesis
MCRHSSVSVALCTRNGAAHLEEQLSSIFGQSVLPDEIVVADDASSDDTVAIVQAAFERGSGYEAHTQPRLVLIQNPEPLGVTANFQRAMEACTGDLVILSDQDDVWHPNRLSVALAIFERSPSLDMLYSDARLVDDIGAPLGQSLFEALGITTVERDAIRAGEGFNALLRRNLVTGATAVVRRALVERAIPFPAPWIHDEWLAIIAAATGDLDFSPKQLIDYRQHASNQIGVRKLGPRDKVRRIREPRGDRNRYLLERAQVLLARLEQLGKLVSADKLQLARGKVEHQRVRADLPSARPQRWLPVLREVRTRRYFLFSRGWGDVVRDLVQPAGAGL